MDDPAVAENTSLASAIGEFPGRLKLKSVLAADEDVSMFSFHHLQLTAPPNPDDLSTEECRLLFHLCTMSANLELTNSARFTPWALKMPEYATSPLC